MRDYITERFSPQGDGRTHLMAAKQPRPADPGTRPVRPGGVPPERRRVQPASALHADRAAGGAADRGRHPAPGMAV